MANGGLSFRSLRQPGRTSAPAVNEYQGQGGRGGLGRITSAFQAGSVESSLTGPGGGLGSLAQGLKDLGAVFEQQEEERQRLEAIEAVSAAQDEERAMLEQMSQMTGSAGYAAPALAGKFYQDLEGRLMEKARGDFQRATYAKALAGMRDQGLNKAVTHRINEHEAYKKETLVGLEDQALRDTAANPASWRANADRIKAADRAMNPNRPPEYQAALDAAKDENQLQNSVLTALSGGNLDQAQGLLDDFNGRGGGKVQGARFVLPTDSHHHITSPFGPRTAPSTPQGKGSSDHRGIDLRMPVGTPVKAISGGTIEFAGNRGGYGVAVIIKHDDGSTTSQYGHLSKLNVQAGTRINAGDVIALSGNTGKSTGPHLDLKVTENGQYVDPAPLLGLTRQGPAGPVGGGSPNPAQSIKLQRLIDQERARYEKTAADGAAALAKSSGTHIAGILNNGVGLAGFDDNLENALSRGGLSREKFEEIAAERDIARRVYEVTRSPDGLFLSLDQAAAELEERFPRPEPLAPGEAVTPEYVRRESAWIMAKTMMEDQRKVFQERQLDYVAPGAQTEYETMLQQGLVPEGREAVTQIEVLRRNAAEKGNLTNAEASLLPATTQTMRDNLSEQWRRAETPEDQKAVFAQWQNNFGEYFPQVLADVGVGHGAMLSTLISPANPELSNVIMQAGLRKESDYKLDKDEKDSINALVTKKMGDGYMGAVAGLRTYRLDDGNARTLYEGLKTAVTLTAFEYKLAGREAKDAVKEIFEAMDSRYSAINDPDLGYVVLEKGKQDEGAVLRGLNAIKEAMGASWDVNDLGQDWDGPTLFRNHQDGVVVDFPNGAGLYFTFAELEEVGRLPQWPEAQSTSPTSAWALQSVAAGTYSTYSEALENWDAAGSTVPKDLRAGVLGIEAAREAIARNKAFQYGPAVSELARGATVERLRGEAPPPAQWTEQPNWKRLKEGKTKGRGR